MMIPLLCFLTVSALVLGLIGRFLSRPSEKTKSCVSDILELTKTNNTYPPMLNVLSSLDSDLEKLGQKLHADMKGYMDYGKDEN